MKYQDFQDNYLDQFRNDPETAIRIDDGQDSEAIALRGEVGLWSLMFKEPSLSPKLSTSTEEQFVYYILGDEPRYARQIHAMLWRAHILAFQAPKPVYKVTRIYSSGSIQRDQIGFAASPEGARDLAQEHAGKRYEINWKTWIDNHQDGVHFDKAIEYTTWYYIEECPVHP